MLENMITALQLRIAMTRFGLSLDAAAKETGVSRATLHRLTVSDANISKAAAGTVESVQSWFEERGALFDQDGVNIKFKQAD